MKNKNGFTLVELLAVIAILAILVIIALPNVMSMFNDAKKNSFLTECKEIYNTAGQQWINDSMFDTKEMEYARCDDCTLKELSLSGRKQLNYYIKLNKAGKVVEFYATDGTYQYIFDEGELEINDIEEAEEIASLGENESLTIKNNEPYKGNAPMCKYKLVTTDGSFSTTEDVKEICLKTVNDNYTYEYNTTSERYPDRRNDSDKLVLAVDAYKFNSNSYVRVYRDSSKNELLASLDYKNKPDTSRINLDNYLKYKSTSYSPYIVEINATSPTGLYVENSDDICRTSCSGDVNTMGFGYVKNINHITFTKPWVNDSETLNSIETLKNSLKDPHIQFLGIVKSSSNTYEVTFNDSTIR